MLVNAFLIVIWTTVAEGGFFWPIFPLVGWGIGIFHAWDVYAAEPSEAGITKETELLRR